MCYSTAKWSTVRRHDTPGSRLSCGVILYSDHLVWHYENWAAPFTDMGAEQTLDDFLAQGARSSIPAEMLTELEAAVRKLIAERDEGQSRQD